MDKNKYLTHDAHCLEFERSKIPDTIANLFKSVLWNYDKDHLTLATMAFMHSGKLRFKTIVSNKDVLGIYNLGYYSVSKTTSININTIIKSLIGSFSVNYGTWLPIYDLDIDKVTYTRIIKSTTDKEDHLVTITYEKELDTCINDYNLESFRLAIYSSHTTDELYDNLATLTNSHGYLLFTIYDNGKSIDVNEHYLKVIGGYEVIDAIRSALFACKKATLDGDIERISKYLFLMFGLANDQSHYDHKYCFLRVINNTVKLLPIVIASSFIRIEDPLPLRLTTKNIFRSRGSYIDSTGIEYSFHFSYVEGKVSLFMMEVSYLAVDFINSISRNSILVYYAEQEDGRIYVKDYIDKDKIIRNINIGYFINDSYIVNEDMIMQPLKDLMALLTKELKK